MILLKFIFWVFVVTMAIGLIFRLFGKQIMTWLVKRLVKKAQKDMEEQSRRYEQYAEASPMEENVYYKDDIKVTVRRGQVEKNEKKKEVDIAEIEEVDWEDLD